MIVSTYLLDSGLFGGFRDEYSVPNNMDIDSTIYENQFLIGIWNGAEWIEGATPEEIAEANKPKVPEEISAMRLMLQLFDMGITDQDIFDDIDSISDTMFSIADKEKAKIKYKTAVTFQRTNAELNFVATMEGLTQEQVDEIFINGNL